jgi:diguanylate cyclase (GGDEF)-like protein
MIGMPGAEAGGLRALESNAVLDAAPAATLDRLTRMASRLLGAPVAIISLVDSHRRLFESAMELEEPWATERETRLADSFCQHPAQQRARLIVEDTREHPTLRDDLAVRDLGVIAYAGVPLFIEGEPVGAICVVDHHPRRWQLHEVRLLDDLAQSVTSEIRLRIALVAEAAHRQQAEELRHVKEMHAAILAKISDGVAFVDGRMRIAFVNEAFARMAASTPGELVGLPRAELFARLRTLVDAPASFEADEGAATRTVETVFVRPQRRIVLRSRMPIDGGQLITWRDVTLARETERKREQQLLVDALTGIANRRAAEVALAALMELAKLSGVPVSVAMLDVDHFKSINDRFGHLAGDEVLRQVAATLSGEARLNDTVARWGGEEFIAILPVAGSGAVVFCERARKAIEGLRCPPVDGVTISVGVAEVGHGDSADDVVARADARLYEAKREGRNRVKL